MELHLKNGSSHTKETVDSLTGEVLDTEVLQHTYVAGSRDDFFMAYSAILGVFMDMDMPDIRVYGYLLRYASGDKFSISRALRIDMSERIHLNERTIYNTIKVLEGKGLLSQINKLYCLNPKYAFKGSSSNRMKALKVFLELEYKNK